MRRLLLVLAALLLPMPALAQPVDAVLTADQALAQDAGEYARRFGVDADEALRRLRAQRASVAITDRLREAYRDRLAGLSLVHRPDFAIRVRLTGPEPVADRVEYEAGFAIPIRFETGAPASGERIVAALRQRRAAIEGIVRHQGYGYDARLGALVVMADASALAGAAPAALERRLTAAAGVPVAVRVLDGAPADAAVGGGGRLEGSDPADGRRYFCTTGFVVADGARTGVVTAAHCPDTAVYIDPGGRQVALDFVGGWGGFFQDVQVHAAAEARQPLFRGGGGGARPLEGQRQRARTRAGEWVCHRGESSGYSCATVELTDYVPPGALCGGPCDASWVTVAGPSCRGGDSGGPVFLGTTAFGILKGANYAADGRCNFYYYMSTDYLPPGWSLLTRPREQPIEAAASSHTSAPVTP